MSRRDDGKRFAHGTANATARPDARSSTGGTTSADDRRAEPIDWEQVYAAIRSATEQVAVRYGLDSFEADVHHGRVLEEALRDDGRLVRSIKGATGPFFVRVAGRIAHRMRREADGRPRTLADPWIAGHKAPSEGSEAAPSPRDRDLEALFGMLGERARGILYARLVLKLPFKGIAEMFGVTTDAARMSYVRARRRVIEICTCERSVFSHLISRRRSVSPNPHGEAAGGSAPRDSMVGATPWPVLTTPIHEGPPRVIRVDRPR